MLLELKVNNFAIIDNLHLSFGPGLNILSGETGAGKSVLLKSLSLLMGIKGSTESIRTNCSKASIEGSFDLSHRPDLISKLHDQGIEAEENLLIVRRILNEEKSRVYLNDTLSTLNNLRNIVAPLIEVAGPTAPLIEMTGQHENRNLLSKSYHLDLLDQYVGAWDSRLKFSKEFHRLQNLRQEAFQLEKDSQAKTQRLDFLIFQKNEISELNLKSGEEILIETELKKLKNSNRIETFVDSAESALYSDDNSATARLHAIIQKASEFNQIDPIISQKLKTLSDAKVLIEDCIYDLRKYVSKMETDLSRQETLEQRLSDFRKLQKKHGPTSGEILKNLGEIEKEIQNLQNSDNRLNEIKTQIEVIEKDLFKLAEDLHQRRSSGSHLLAKSVNTELLDLNMKGVAFHVSISKQTELSSNGISDVEFMSQSSPNDPPRSLSKFASGGELSRILLSLKCVAGSSQQPRTYLFDEVDSGVSGPTAEKVGKKLKSIAKDQQVICVTHLPQVAAYGDIHFFIQKSPLKGSVFMEISKLDNKERIKEIARLISGEKISKTSLAHAEQLIKESSGSFL